MKKKLSFVLIEFLIGLSILSMIVVCLFSAFSLGVRIYQRVEKDTDNVAVLISLEELEDDLRSTFFFDKIAFQGTEEELSFPGLVRGKESDRRWVGRITYSVDNGWLTKVNARYEEVVSPHAEFGENGSKRPLCRVRKVWFSYYYYDAKEKTYVWKSEWTGGGMPLAVQVEIDVEGDEEGNRFERIIFIPVSR